MPRIKLIEKQDYCFSTNCVVRLDDINFANHLDNGRLVILLSEARLRFFKELGSKGWDIGDGITGILIGDLCVNYKAEVFYGDEISIECDIDEIEKRSFRVFYRVIRGGKTAALAESGAVCINFQTGAITDVPAVFAERLNIMKSSKKQ